MWCCFYRENNKNDAMKTSMCIVSEFFFSIFISILFFPLLLFNCVDSLHHFNSLEQRKVFKILVHLVLASEKRISHVLKLMILNFTLFNRITMSLVYNFIVWHLIRLIFHFVKSFRYTQHFKSVLRLCIYLYYYLHHQLSPRIFHCYRGRDSNRNQLAT